MNDKTILALIGIITSVISISAYGEQKTISLFHKSANFLSNIPHVLSAREWCSKKNFSAVAKKVATESKESAKIIGGSIGAAVFYGIIQDQVTARICLEYFSKNFHGEMVKTWVDDPLMSRLKLVLENTSSPTVYGIIWGTVATWWVGALLGIPLGAISRIGSWPKLTISDLKIPILSSLGIMGISSALAGLWGFIDFSKNPHCLDSFLDLSDIPNNKRRAFAVNTYAHQMAYLSGALSGLGCIGYALYKRYKKKKELQVTMAS